MIKNVYSLCGFFSGFEKVLSARHPSDNIFATFYYASKLYENISGSTENSISSKAKKLTKTRKTHLIESN